MKHTHTGHCQLCDRQQAVNVKHGTLAKHGYTKRWGFFSGTCPGSGNLPYEQSAALIPPVITSVSETIKRLKVAVAEVHALVDTDPTYGEATFERDLPQGKRTWGGSREERKTVAGHFSVEKTEKMTGGWDMIYSKFTASEPVSFQDGTTAQELDSHTLYRTSYGSCHNPEEHAAKWRAGEIRTLELTLSRNAEYKKWLNERVLAWKLADLTPVSKI